MGGPLRAHAKAVFAHMIIGNTAGSTPDDWADDIEKAKDAGIDGFALNIAPGDSYTGTSLTNAYNAADSAGNFSLFLSFDYLSQGAWPAANVITTINTYASHSSQFHYNGKPLVSTFEGTSNVNDWPGIKSATGCTFIPDWSSLGAQGIPLDVVDGAFSWNAWPNGPENMTDTDDIAWKTALNGKPYMMGVSPWFYTNLPQWNKNWLWRGDGLWSTRWEQVIALQPELVEIITWNDYGESHYIGPVRAQGIPESASRYVDNMPHDHWRDLLPFYIAAYKNASAPAITADKVVFYHRPNPAANAGSATGGTTGNNPSQGQQAYAPGDLLEDNIYVDVLVIAPSTVNVQIGSNSATTWQAPHAGINNITVPFNGQTGTVNVTVQRNGQNVAAASGPGITDALDGGLINWNAYVGGSG
ncbi:hypothetical protein MMC12_001286 [Toensbergia leucococca]|nr:hypothetical protein [Toensbergia leucococca]